MTNAGQEEFSYDSFKMAYDADPVIQALVTKFDKNGVELKTKKGDNSTAPSDAEEGSKTVSQMAKRATNKALG